MRLINHDQITSVSHAYNAIKGSVANTTSTDSMHWLTCTAIFRHVTGTTHPVRAMVKPVHTMLMQALR